MSNELDTLNPNALVDVPQRTPSQSALDMLKSQAQAMVAAKQLADALCASDMVPEIYQGKPGNGAAAILYGAELGLNPIQSLQQIFVVYGKPAIYARTMVALVKARGYQIRTVDSTDESVTVVGVAPDGSQEQSTWTYERAKKAGYTSNKKYDTDPQAMLYAKAASEVCRKLAPDVLLGITHTVEDLQSEPIRAESVRIDPPARRTVAEVLATPPAPAEPMAPEDRPEPMHPMSTLAQQKKLAILLGKHGVDTRDAKLAYLKEQFGREFTSSKQLTRDEISSLIDFLESSGQPDPDQPASDGAQA